MKYKDKEKVVSEAWFAVMANEAWGDILKYGDLGFPLAYAAQNDLVEVNKTGQDYITEVYGVLLQSLGLPDVEYGSFTEMNEAAIQLQEN